ncbi:argininosuccinate synthase [Streptococcus pneumoniae]|nr:argininosuccinate synthase [Streptococcus pneumoniae]
MSKEKVILAYSGGLDTSVAITWLKKDYDVVSVCMDVGEGKDLDFIHDKALKVGAVESYVIDVKDEFATDYVLVAHQSHAYYEQKYPLVSALSRPLISKKLVEIAHQIGATTIAHGCTGKGNDQVRFEVSIAALDLNLKVIAPVREWKWSREEEIYYAKENGVPVPADLDNPYSVDQNLWGRAKSVVFWKIHGIRLQKKPLASQLLQSKLQICQNTLRLSLVKVFQFPSMEKC